MVGGVGARKVEVEVEVESEIEINFGKDRRCVVILHGN